MKRISARWIPHLLTKEQKLALVRITKESQRAYKAKRTMSIKKVMYVIFYTNQGPAIQIAMPKVK
jgi:hypothetical protein